MKREKWIIRQEKAKCVNQMIDIWYVGPKTDLYGFATFTIESAAGHFQQQINKELQTEEG